MNEIFADRQAGKCSDIYITGEMWRRQTIVEELLDAGSGLFLLPGSDSPN
jgi:hypothetical protein